MQQPNDVKQLIEKYLAGQCTEQEKAFLETWYLNYTEQSLPQLSAAQLKDIQNSFPQVLGSDRKSIAVWTRLAAASVLLFAIAGTYLVLHKNKPLLAEQYVSPAIKPGNNKAILTLANGNKVVLTDAGIGKLADEGNSIVEKTTSGQLVYNAKPETGAAAELFNTLETPKGGIYDVVLADGTKVWLNAASSLKYPTSFTGKQRRVELHGEGYFEVAKNKAMPFIVTSNNQQVEVLGTHFDISAYDDDNGVYKTTLLEGSVRLNMQTILEPGEQAINTNQKIRVKQVDTEDAIAWKNGKFKFKNENIQDLMRKIARWYDVEVVYDGEMTRKDFSGTVSRFDNIVKILTMLESTHTIHFKIEGRRITVMP